MDVSTPPSLDLACVQAKDELDNHDHMFRERGIDKTKYRHGSIMIINIASTSHHTSHNQVTIHPQC